MTREGVVEAMRPIALMFREAAMAPLTSLPGRAVGRERVLISGATEAAEGTE
jgi:hypothetical protein